MSVSQYYLSPAATPNSMMQSPLAVQAPTAAEDDDFRLRADIERTLLKISQDLYELEVCAGDVTAGQEDRVPMYMQEVNKGLIQLSEMAGRLQDSVPQQVVEYIDNYRNPHMYTRSAISRATGENQYALGRALGLESFRRQLEDSISSEFPSIPLPPRRHQPILPNGTPGETEVNGTRENGDSGVANGDVKYENKEGASTSVNNGHAEPTANGTHP